MNKITPPPLSPLFNVPDHSRPLSKEMDAFLKSTLDLSFELMANILTHGYNINTVFEKGGGHQDKDDTVCSLRLLPERGSLTNLVGLITRKKEFGMYSAGDFTHQIEEFLKDYRKNFKKLYNQDCTGFVYSGDSEYLLLLDKEKPNQILSFSTAILMSYTSNCRNKKVAQSETISNLSEILGTLLDGFVAEGGHFIKNFEKLVKLRH